MTDDFPVPFCIIRLDSDTDAATLVSRAILTQSIYELWATGDSYESLHSSITSRTQHLWPLYKETSFSFHIDSFQGSRSNSAKKAIIDSFSYLPFDGPIAMKNPDVTFTVLEDGRKVIDRYDLKKRRYISTTSMDSELALLTANFALASPGKLCYDPFTGTGSFPVACAHFGATVLGSDIDGRSIRGKPNRNVVSNFEQYGLVARYLDGFVSDLTNSPLRMARWLDGIVCDPPYGVREGLKVLGSARHDLQHEIRLPDGRLAHLAEGYIPPKRAYSFDAMLDDILDFSYEMLVDDGRLCMWMPTANDEDIEIAVPSHPALELVSICVQQFNRWARRLLTYRRLPQSQVDQNAVKARIRSAKAEGTTADELNSFRRKVEIELTLWAFGVLANAVQYFQGFKDASGTSTSAEPA
ncbi:hypothetical protein H2203_001360 [Taxawa tesnikishii (nom. ined.)]|nr:hypothetical protein H2203_001360 [Dothideales sp. JES 119]